MNDKKPHQQDQLDGSVDNHLNIKHQEMFDQLIKNYDHLDDHLKKLIENIEEFADQELKQEIDKNISRESIIDLTVDDHLHCAYLSLSLQSHHRTISMEHIKEFLEKQHIVYGINYNKIQQCLNQYNLENKSVEKLQWQQGILLLQKVIILLALYTMIGSAKPIKKMKTLITKLETYC